MGKGISGEEIVDMLLKDHGIDSTRIGSVAKNVYFDQHFHLSRMDTFETSDWFSFSP